jgi:hypothetical protein
MMGNVIPEVYTYKVIGGKVTITGYTGPGGEIAIPSTIGGLPVVAIGSYAFDSCLSLTGVQIPSGINVGDYAFYGCASIAYYSTIGGPESTEIQSHSVQAHLALMATQNSNITIGDYAFSHCANLSQVNMGDAFTSIGNFTFQRCSSLASITVGNGVEAIGNNAFDSCTSLTSVVIGTSVKSIGDCAFNSCTNLTSITFSGLTAPISVGDSWLNNTSTEIRGHAVAASNFPAPGGVWSGLMMGANAANIATSNDDSSLLLLLAVIVTAVVLVAGLVAMAVDLRKRKDTK